MKIKNNSWSIFCFFGLFFLFSCKFFYMEPVRVIDSFPSADNLNNPPEMVWVKFSQPMDQAKTESAFTLLADKKKVNGTFEWPDYRTLCFRPRQFLPKKADFVAQVSLIAEDIYHNSLVKDFQREFTTKTESRPPQVTSILPADGSRSDNRQPDIVVAFSEAIEPESFVSGFSLQPEVPGSIKWSPDKRRFAFRPIEFLTHNTQYVCVLSTEITDLQNNPLATEINSLFTVGVDLEPPTIAWAQSSGDGGITLFPDNPNDDVLTETTGLSSRAKIIIQFNEAIKTKNLNAAIALYPRQDFKLDNQGARQTDRVTIEFTEPLKYDQPYLIEIEPLLQDVSGNYMKEEVLYHFRVTAEDSRPVKIKNVSYQSDPFDITPESMLLLRDQDTIDLSRYAQEIGSADLPPYTGVFAFTFSLATGANLDPLTIRENFSITVGNDCVSLLPLAVFVDKIDSGAAPDSGNLWLVKIVADIQNYSDRTGFITMRFDSDTQDSLGNKLTKPWLATFPCF